MKRKYLFTLLLTVFFAINTLFSFHSYAQNSVSGDSVCGGSGVTYDANGKIIGGACGVDDLKIISQGIFKLVISIGLPLLIVFIIYRILMAWFALQQGNASAYKEAGKNITEAIIGFIIIVALFGGIFLAVLRYIGASSFTTDLLRRISSIEIIPHAYADTASCGPATIGTPCTFIPSDGAVLTGTITQTIGSGLLVCKSGNVVNGSEYASITDCSTKANGTLCKRNDYYGTVGICSGGTPVQAAVVPVVQTNQTTATQPTTGGASSVTGPTSLPNPLGATSLYDFILSLVNMAMKFFLYPAMIAMWTWSGFSYVLAQGAPEKLKKTHNLILWAFISTLVIFMTQAFLIAIRGTVNNILPGASQTQAVPYQVTTSGQNQPTATGANAACDLGNGITGITGVGGVCYSSGRR